MGCSCSKQQDLYIDVPRALSTTGTCALRQKSFVDGCKLLPFTASCPASYPYQSLTRVIVGEDHLFGALWDGINGAQAARHCAAGCYETFLQCLESNADPCWALRQTTQQLDKSYLASNLPDAVKAGVGATGIMVYVHTSSNKCFVARLGDALPFLAASQGSFHTTTVEIKPLSSSKHHRLKADTEAQAQQQQRIKAAASKQHAVPHGAASSSARTHAIGLGYGKVKKLQQLWLKQEAGATSRHHAQQVLSVSSDCEVTMCQLCPGDESIVLASEGLLQLLPATEVGLLLHHFNAAKLNVLSMSYLAVAAQQQKGAAAATQSQVRKGKPQSKCKGKNGTPDADAVNAAGQVVRHPNVASIVMHYALAKALDKHNLARARQQGQLSAGQQQQHQQQQLGPSWPSMSHEQLTHLPLLVDKEAFRPAGSQGSAVQLHLPKQYPTGGLCRRDVHEDMGIVVIALSWPSTQDSQSLLGMSPARPGRTIIRPDAQYRWQLLRLAVKSNVAYRRTLRCRWWQVLEQAEAAAEAAARQAEVQAWKSSGAVEKVNLMGDVLGPEAPIRLRSSPQKPLSSSRKRRTTSSSSMAAIGSIGPAQPALSATTPATKAQADGAGSGKSGFARNAGGSAHCSSSTPSAAMAAMTAVAQAAAAAAAAGVPQLLQLSDINCRLRDIEPMTDAQSPHKLNSPTKSAATAALPSKKNDINTSPVKGYNKQRLSLRSSRAPAARAAVINAATHTQHFIPGSNSGIVADTVSPGQMRASRILGVAEPDIGAGRKGISLGTSLAAAVGKGGSPAAGLGYSGYNAASYGAAGAGRTGSPTKLSKQRLSLRKPASHI